MIKKTLNRVATLGLMTIVGVSGYNIGKMESSIMENESYKIEHVEREDGKWELYVDLKDGQMVSEVPVSNKGDSVLIAPDQK